MVVLAASICTKGGKAVISRQFIDMSRARIDSLLASFPKVIPTNTQHTSVETSDVRYVYQPLEDLYILLITNKASNILQDIETLHLFARVVSDMCRSADQREIVKNSFDILEAFDEIISMGYREAVNMMQVRNNLEMESHEEKIQEIIARNKEAEAKEELKRRAKQLEMQRREQQRRTAAGGPSTGSYLGGGISGYAPVPQRFEAPTPIRTSSPAPSSLRTPQFKGSGMKLGSKKTTQSQLLDALGGEALLSEDMSVPGTPAPPEPVAAAPKDESYVPLSINCWPTPSNDGTCDVNIEYELENEGLVLHDVVISIPLPDGSYPTVSNHTGEWSLNSSSHAIDWNIGRVDSQDRSGTLEFSVGGDDPGVFFPVKVGFVAQGSLAGARVASVAKVEDGEDVPFSEDASLVVLNYTVV